MSILIDGSRVRRWKVAPPSWWCFGRPASPLRPESEQALPLPRASLYSQGCVIGSEFCERFSFYGMKAVLGRFFVEVLGMGEGGATEALAFFTVGCYLTPLLGAYLSDARWGRYSTIAALSGVHLIGNAALALAALAATAAPYSGQAGGGGSSSGSSGVGSSSGSAMVFVALAITALGTGGIKPCVSAFGGDQVAPPKDPGRTRRFFAAFYFAINAGSLLSSVLTPVVRAAYGYPAAFALPAALMGVALAAFVHGKNNYRHVPPQGDLLGRVAGVLWAAARAKAKDPWGAPFAACLDATAAPGGGRGQGPGPGSSAALVGDVKRLGLVLLLFAPAPVFWCLFDQQASRWTFQATRMDCRLGPGLTVQPEMVQSLNAFFILLFIPLFERALYPAVATICGQSAANHAVRRMAAGMGLAAVSFGLAAALQARIDSAEAARRGGGDGGAHQVWVVWQVPQYAVMTAGEVLFSATGLEFAFKEAPDSMKAVVQSAWLLTTAAGNLLTVAVLESVTARAALSQTSEFLVFAGGCAASMAAFLVLAHASGFQQRQDLGGGSESSAAGGGLSGGPGRVPIGSGGGGTYGGGGDDDRESGCGLCGRSEEDGEGGEVAEDEEDEAAEDESGVALVAYGAERDRRTAAAVGAGTAVSLSAAAPSNRRRHRSEGGKSGGVGGWLSHQPSHPSPRATLPRRRPMPGTAAAFDGGAGCTGVDSDEAAAAAADAGARYRAASRGDGAENRFDAFPNPLV